jgi:mono/diheme cytochrome c family protein
MSVEEILRLRTGLLALLPVFLLSAVLAQARPAARGQEPTPEDAAKASAADVKEGASLFRTNCSPCHGLNARGGGRNNHYGLPLVYDTVTVVTAAGEKITGVAKNEDTFSVQLMTAREELHFFLKKDLKEVIHEHKSLMPPYPESTLSQIELQDLIAYLVTLRGTERGNVKEEK